MRKFVLISALAAAAVLPAWAEDVDDGVSCGYVGEIGRAHV